MNHVFISYRQESPEHNRAVRRLGELLRQAKLPVALDEFYLDDHPGGPDDGWPKWCEDRAIQSKCVLVIPSVGWFAAYNGAAGPNVRRGSATEARLFRQYLYEGPNERIRLAYVDAPERSDPIPEGLKAWHRFQPFASDRDLDQLVAWIAGRLGLNEVQTPTVRWPEPLPDYRPDLANRHIDEWPAVVDMLTGRSQQRIVMFCAASGFGKSELIHHSHAYAEQLGMLTARVDFKAISNTNDLLGRIDLDVGAALGSFSSEGGTKSHLLLKDLRALRQPLLIILDSYEKATPELQDWVCQNLLPEVARSLGLVVILAGHSCPDVEDVRWRGLARLLRLGPINEPQHWEEWLLRRHPHICGRIDIPTLILASGGVPKSFSDLCVTAAQSLVSKR